MARDDSYFHFPIKTLRDDRHPKSLNDSEFRSKIVKGVRYSISNLASSTDDLDDEVFYVAQDYANKHDLEGVLSSRAGIRLLYAASKLDVIRIDAALSKYDQTKKEISNLPGGNTMVRIRNDLFWDAADKQRLSPVQFQSLCALYAAIGQDSVKCVRRSLLTALANGYASPDEMGDPKLSHLIQKHQVVTALRSLNSRGLFEHVCVDRRNTYYSMRYKGIDFLGLVGAQIAMRESPRDEHEIVGNEAKANEVERCIKLHRKHRAKKQQKQG